MSRRHQSLRLMPSRLDEETPASNKAAQAAREKAGGERRPLRAKPADSGEDDETRDEPEE